MLREILSRLPVKSLMRFMCVSKSFQSLILDPRFERMHLQNSRKSTNFLLGYGNGGETSYVVPAPISYLIEDSTSFFDGDIINGSKAHWKKDRVLGSCNGLVCLAKWNENGIMFNLWNPATKKEFGNLTLAEIDELVMLGFGYDNSRHSYKVVAIVGNLNTVDNLPYRTLIGSPNDERGWREIQYFPTVSTSVEGDAVYLNNTLNWLGIPTYNDSDDDMDDFLTLNDVVIVSLDLETETYREMLLPRELNNGVFIGYFCCFFEQVHCNEGPLFGVLGGCLSVFVHNRETKDFSIWQMKEFGNRRSWTLLLNTSLEDLGVNMDEPYSILLPLCMVENDRDIVIIHSSFQECVKQTIVYNMRDNTVLTSRNVTRNLLWIYPFDYVESLISPIA
ncbi:F-box/kelch-repeat protein At3g23880-like [Vigna umbellata]|uniref:F-box/kelch-repeat protein At3g23880-like n=1 Tax=Vigna umbellata TaxID=87088 RepID=UPI001F5F1CD9|nr:F-box/kelch-repeat protein At3g23880-like [Vigna umbellata]